VDLLRDLDLEAACLRFFTSARGSESSEDEERLRLFPFARLGCGVTDRESGDRDSTRLRRRRGGLRDRERDSLIDGELDLSFGVGDLERGLRNLLLSLLGENALS
jgi:hypothetical protein